MDYIVNGHKYVLKQYSHLEETILEDCGYELIPVPGPDGKADSQIKTNRAMIISLTIFFSLESWDIKDAAGADIPLPANRVKVNNIPRLDMDGYLAFAAAFPPHDKQELFVAASKLNRLGEAEKNSLSGSSAEI